VHDLRECRDYGGGISAWDCGLTVRNTIISFSGDGRGALCMGSGTLELSCCDVYGNIEGDWVGCIQSQYGISGNISADPLFCDAPEGTSACSSIPPALPSRRRIPTAT